jgi:hypothetical protein
MRGTEAFAASIICLSPNGITSSCLFDFEGATVAQLWVQPK